MGSWLDRTFFKGIFLNFSSKANICVWSCLIYWASNFTIHLHNGFLYPRTSACLLSGNICLIQTTLVISTKLRIHEMKWPKRYIFIKDIKLLLAGLMIGNFPLKIIFLKSRLLHYLSFKIVLYFFSNLLKVHVLSPGVKIFYVQLSNPVL